MLWSSEESYSEHQCKSIETSFLVFNPILRLIEENPWLRPDNPRRLEPLAPTASPLARAPREDKSIEGLILPQAEAESPRGFISVDSPVGLVPKPCTNNVKIINGTNAMLEAIKDETGRLLDGNLALPRKVATSLLTSLADHVQGGALFVYAPTSEVRSMRWEHTDDGYFCRRLDRQKIYDVMEHASAFGEAVRELSTHAHGDRWPSTHPDADARGKSKDGGWLISTTGKVRLAAVKFKPVACPFAWTEVGTRHSAALDVAHSLNKGLVLVVSESGGLHAITASGAQRGLVHRTSMVDLRRALCNEGV